MPELPEVETLRRELASAVKNKTIKSVRIKVSKMVKPLSPAKFQQKIKNKKILDINRRAKVLIFELSGGFFLMIHLKLTGQLIFKPKNLPPTPYNLVIGGHPQKGGTENLPNKFTHIIFSFTDQSKLYFNDMRKFGWMKLLNQSDMNKLSAEFGVEPLEREFTLKKFKEILNRYPNRKIKQILLDQKLIAGIGNIYNDEACFCAKILPSRRSKTLKEKEIKNLHKCITKILKLAILKKGTSANTYIQLSGKPGGMMPYLKVYARKGKKCKRCQGTIEKIQMNGRGTHFCKQCQR